MTTSLNRRGSNWNVDKKHQPGVHIGRYAVDVERIEMEIHVTFITLMQTAAVHVLLFTVVVALKNVRIGLIHLAGTLNRAFEK